MTHDTTARRLLLLVADGVRPDVLAEEMAAGRAPALADLAERGGLHAVTSSFPSVTGPAYIPFLMGRHPARAGVPGLRWYDRARSLTWSPSPAPRCTRSYAGIDIWQLDRDIDPTLPTLFDLAQPSLAGMSILARGASHGRIGRSFAWMCRAAPSHFRGNLLGWQQVEREASAHFLRRFARVRPRFSLLAITSPDKLAHKYGAHSQAVRSAIRDLDTVVAAARSIAARDGWSDTLHIWVVGDHGHASVSHHEDLHQWLEDDGWRVLAHPRLHVRGADIALMVGGNAMAHLYLEPAISSRQWWGALADRWSGLADRLLARPSVDLLVVAHSATEVDVRHAKRGTARIHVHDVAPDDAHHERRRATRWSYVPTTGDPLQLGGAHHQLDMQAAWDLTAHGAYPDALVQLSWLATSPRSGDLLLSATEGWDLRARFEPVNHVSTHGALLRDQMLVPLLIDMPPLRLPRRTADVVPSVVDVLGLDVDAEFDGQSFVQGTL